MDFNSFFGAFQALDYREYFFRIIRSIARILLLCSRFISPSFSVFRKRTDIAPLARVWRELWHDGERTPSIFRQATVWYALFVLDVAAVATVVPVTARCPPRYRYALSATRCVCIVHSCYVTLVIVCASSLHACMEKGRVEGGFAAAAANERRMEKKKGARTRTDFCSSRI